MARFVILPFSVGCTSHSSVAVHENQPKRAQAEAFPATSSGDAKAQPTGKPKNSFSNLSFPRPNLSLGFQKLVESFKNLSNCFAFDEEEEDDDEMEMEIGLPTEVQHVTQREELGQGPGDALPSFFSTKAVRAGIGSANWSSSATGRRPPWFLAALRLAAAAATAVVHLLLCSFLWSSVSYNLLLMFIESSHVDLYSSS